MARQNTLPTELEAPFGGLNDFVNPKSIADNDFQECSNVMCRAGAIAPRPGTTKQSGIPLSVFARSFADGKETTTFTSPRGVAFDQTNSKVYWTTADNTYIYSRDVTGTSNTQAFDTTSTSYVIDIAVYPNNYVYWIDPSARKIHRTAWGFGGAIDTLVTLGAGNTPRNLVLDVTGGRIYYTVHNAGGDYIGWIPLAGGAETVLLTGLVANRAFGIAYNSGTLYFANGRYLQSTPTTAPVATTLYDSGDATILNRGVVIDTANNYLYWLNTTNALTSRLYRSSLTGTNRVTYLAPAGFGDVYGLARQTSTGRLYFADSSTGVSKIWMVSAPTDYRITSTYWWERNVLGVDAASETISDIVLCQAISNTFDETRMFAYFPTDDKKYPLDCGYVAPGSTAEPGIFVTNDRDVDSAAGAPWRSGSSGRATFAYTGQGINTGKGGVLIADGSGGAMFNYVLGSTIQTMTLTGTPTGGTFTVIFDGNTSDPSSTIAYNASSDAVRESLSSIAALGGSCTVTGSAGGPWTIVLGGYYAGQSAPLLTLQTNGLTGGTAPSVSFATTQTGGTDTGACLYLIPAGMPRPTSVVASDGGAVGVLDGYYEYYITNYSPLFDMESPPTFVSSSILINLRKVTLTISNPSTIYFDEPSGGTYAVPFGPVCSQVRLYRRKRGSYAGGSSGGGDGVGADATWYYTNFQWSDTSTWLENAADTVIDLSSPLRSSTEYPPENAQWVETIGGRSVWAGTDHNVWYSELTKFGGIGSGELGYCYVSNISYFTPDFLRASDTPLTGLKRYNGLLLIGTPYEVVATSLDNVDTTPPTVVALRGVTGWASQWMIAETNALADSDNTLYWMNHFGHVYSFNGSDTQLISRKIDTTSRVLHRKYWHNKDDTIGATPVGYYWGSAVVDPLRNNVLFFVTAITGDEERILCLSLDNGQWYPWDIGSNGCPVLGRETTNVTTYSYLAAASPAVYYSSPDDGYLYKFEDGYADNDVAMPWSYTTKRFSLGSHPMYKLIHDAFFTFNMRSVSSGNPTVTITPYVYGATGQVQISPAFSTTVSAATGSRARVKVSNTGVSHVEFVVNGSQANGYHQPELIGVKINFEPDTGAERN